MCQCRNAPTGRLSTEAGAVWAGRLCHFLHTNPQLSPWQAARAGAKPHLLPLPGGQPGIQCLAWNPVHSVLALTGVEVRPASRSGDAGTLLIYALSAG